MEGDMDAIAPYDSDYQPLAEGIFRIPFVHYCQINALNSSVLKYGEASMAHLRAQIDKAYTPPSWQMIEGQAFHLLTLEPERWDEEFVLEPLGGWLNEKTGKMTMSKSSGAYQNWKLDQGQKMIIGAEGVEKARAMVRNMVSKPGCRKILKSGWPERTVLWKDPEYGFFCRARVDWISIDRTVVDLKKTMSVASPYGFRRTMDRLKYNWQAAFYLRGLKVVTGVDHGPFYWFAWESEPPFEGRRIRASAADLAEAEVGIDEVLKEYSKSLQTGIWNGYPDEEICFGDDYSEYVEYATEDEEEAEDY